MVLNAAVQMLREADELKQQILKFKSGTSMLQERSLWATQQQLQKVYQKVLVLDLDYALDKKVEQDLWNVGFKQQIEALQAISRDRKNPLRSEGQAMLSWVLQAAAGFYLCLLHQICTAFRVDLPFRRRASLLGWVEGWGAGGNCEARGASPAARYICQHCLVHLGDLARYRQHLRVAHTFYRHALVVSAHSGQPYNQLALVAWRRGRRLGALYWHVRSLMVRAPFPPAPANLARTLQAAASSGRDVKDLPVLPGVTSPPTEAPPVTSSVRLDAHSYVTELIRAIHLIHTVEQLETAASLVNSLNSSLTALVATDSFESMTLIKMAVVIIWLVHSSTEGLEPESAALTESESTAAALAESLASGAILALLLPAYTLPAPPPRALPALKVWLQWFVGRPRGGWEHRPQLYPAIAHTLTRLADTTHTHAHKYESVPLPEDEELLGFVPLEKELLGLSFPNHGVWDTYTHRVPHVPAEGPDTGSPCEVSPGWLSNQPELEHKVRAHRLIHLGKRIADLYPQHITYTEEDGKVSFTAAAIGGEQLCQALAELEAVGTTEPNPHNIDEEGDSDDEPTHPPPPIVISEADFREKVREKRVGILKPQGSLERAREERAHATIQEDESESVEESRPRDCTESREARKPRVNIAMAAIMRKQEENTKQVKFVTPPPTPDSTTDTAETKEQDKPKVIQPKAIKSLANLPIGKRTGGILSLKDKSAGYPHLVNTDPEPTKKDEEKKKDAKPIQGSSQNSQQNYQKRQEHPQTPNWGQNPAQNFQDPRMSFPKPYGIQNSAIYSPNYSPNQQNINNQGIRLPVVNPKEIDVRTAALQKQNSRQELFQDGHKFRQVSGDKKNFLNDLPPRFANQYRYWQSTQDNQFNENKFRDENFQSNNTLFNRPNWINTAIPENYQQPSWWKPENQNQTPQNFNLNFNPPVNVQPNFYSPHLGTNMTTPYQNMSTFNQPNQNLGQEKPQNLISHQNYLQTAIGQPQMPTPTLRNLVSSPNFNSSLNNFTYNTPTVGYDSSMYPQFNNKLGYQMKMLDKPQSYQGDKSLMDVGGLNFGSNVLEMQQRNLNMKFSEPASEMGGAKNLEQNVGESSSGEGSSGNTYPGGISTGATSNTFPGGTTANTYPGAISGGTTGNTYNAGVSGGTSANTFPGGITINTHPGSATANTYPGGISGGATANTYPGSTSAGGAANTFPGGISAGTTANTYSGGVSGGTTGNTYPGVTTANTYPGGISAGTTGNTYPGGVSGGTTGNTYHGGTTANTYPGGISGGATANTYPGGISGGATANTYPGGISGGATANTYPGGISGGATGNTYSLFSGAPGNSVWGAAHPQPHQSLWSGPGPSPLERLLEQQKQLKHPPAPQ